MKIAVKLFLVLFNFVFQFPVDLIAQQKDSINFIKGENWNDILAKAKKENKLIFIDAYTTWCGPCKSMDEQVFSHTEVGQLFNKHFISVKIQMDRTSRDNEYVKSWYNDADKIKFAEKIEAFPSLLFYTANGELLLKSIGFKSPASLNKIASYISNSSVTDEFKKNLLAYQNGQRDLDKIPELIATVREVLGDRQLAKEMSMEYKKNYLEKLPPDQFLTRKNIRFIADNGGAGLVNSNDNFFKACYNEPVLIDSVLGEGSAEWCVKLVVNREEVSEQLYSNNKPISLHPNWKKIADKLHKYKKIDPERTLLRAKVDFYRKIEDWETYTLLRTEEIKRYPRKAYEMGLFDSLNQVAWDVFQHCNEKKSLERALEWSILSIELEMPNPNCEFYDTKANLLHKLGRTIEAIPTQELAKSCLEKTNVDRELIYHSDINSNLEKMKKGLPTWK
jgi:thioredoxin-related protein